MSPSSSNISLPQWLGPLIICVAGLIAGVILEKLVLAKLRKLTDKTKWEGDEIIIRSMKGMLTFWVLGAGIYAALISLPEKSALISFLEKMLLATVIFSVTLFVARMVVGFINLYLKKKEGILPSTSIFLNIAKISIILLGVMVILQTLGISITPILTALGVGGLAVALALQDTLSNLFAGLQIIISKQIKPGDYVKLSSGDEGYVTDVTWRNTTIRALANNMIIVPNSQLASAIITNFHQPEEEMSLIIQAGVSYNSDLDLVERITLAVAREVLQEIPGSVSDYEPAVRFHTLGEYSIDFAVVLRVKEFTNQYMIKHEFIKRLFRRYQQEGIEIPFPVRTVLVQNKVEGFPHTLGENERILSGKEVARR